MFIYSYMNFHNFQTLNQNAFWMNLYNEWMNRRADAPCFVLATFRTHWLNVWFLIRKDFLNTKKRKTITDTDNTYSILLVTYGTEVLCVSLYAISSVWVRERESLLCSRRGLRSFSKRTERVSGLFLQTSLSTASSFPSRSESVFIIFCIAFILSSLLLQNSDDNQLY